MVLDPALLSLMGTLAGKCASIIKAVSDYVRDVRHAPDIISRIHGQVNIWELQLGSLRLPAERDELNGNAMAVLQSNDVLGEAQECLTRLEQLLEKAPRPREQLGIQRGQIQLALETSNTVTLTETAIDTRAIHEEIKQLCSVQEQQEILSWIEPNFPKNSDPETLQNEKSSLQEKNTCDWMVKSAWWHDWLEGGPSSPDGCWRFLWIHGLPGSGKTILASYLIDQVGRHCTSKGYSYYYCFHDHNRDETTSLLRWVIRDLTMQLGRCIQENYISKELYSMWEEKRPTVDILLHCLKVLTWEFFTRFSKRVYIVVDGVDESKMPRVKLLQVLTDIGTKPAFEHVSLLITSRDHPDIRNAISKLPPQAMPVRREVHDSLIPAQPSQQPALILSHQDVVLPVRGRPSYSPYGPTDRSVSPGLDAEPSQVLNGRFEGMDFEDPVMPSFYMRQNYDNSAGSTKQKRQASGNQEARASSPQKRKISPGGSYVDVGLRATPCSILSMSNPFVKEAIETFIQEQLNSSERFLGWPRPEFIERMKIELAAKAGGMFRTVSCHLDMIERLDLTDESSILKEINDMPMMVFEMYEKIVVDGMSLLEAGDRNRHNREFARTALALISSDTSDIPDAGVLVEAARLHVPQWYAQDYNFKKLERLLGCLAKVTCLKRKTPSLYRRDDEISTSAGLHRKRFSLAHYTVKEYLYHKKTAEGPAREFALSSEKNRILELTVVFYGLRNYSTSGPPKRNPTRFDEYCLKMTEKALGERPSVVLKEEDIWTAVLACLEWSAAHQNAIRNKATRDAFPKWAMLAAAFEEGYTPKYQETSVLVSLLLLRWHQLAHVYLGTLTVEEKDKVWSDEFSLREYDCKTVSRWPSRVAAPNSYEPDILYRALEDPYGNDETCNGRTTGKILKTLLDRGAKPNPKGYKFTPLQLATRHFDSFWVNRLLCSGADPNAVGDPQGISPPGFESDRSWHKKTPMEICQDKSVKPEWEQDEDDDGEMDNSQKRVQELLSHFQDKSHKGHTIVELLDDD
ncbi:Vegetative incompatibility protein HET-E-1 [Cytospora mali]|uniref:Vegetative incompatibility protein HET-E-1 n=1 Tax=Cytospora mali TaxID=578113 RepID=A0A194V333_CYTMA|nr:Vegetative incompatibility protein HET-E-1 [Valsa mali var. pyri (nom. inval.)]